MSWPDWMAHLTLASPVILPLVSKINANLPICSDILTIRFLGIKGATTCMDFKRSHSIK